MSEYHVKRRIPWSSSPRFSNGAKMYGLLTSQVFAGEGRLLATVALTIAHPTTMITPPSKGRTNQSGPPQPFPFAFDCMTLLVSSLGAVHGEAHRVLLGLLGVELHLVEEHLGFVVAT